jgi:hypothetical protein
MIFGVPDFPQKLVIIIMIIMLTTSMAIHMMIFENRMAFQPAADFSLYQLPIEKRQTVGADLRVRPLWAHPWVRPYQKTGLIDQGVIGCTKLSASGRRILGPKR